MNLFRLWNLSLCFLENLLGQWLRLFRQRKLLRLFPFRLLSHSNLWNLFDLFDLLSLSNLLRLFRLWNLNCLYYQHQRGQWLRCYR